MREYTKSIIFSVRQSTPAERFALSTY